MSTPTDFQQEPATAAAAGTTGAELVVANPAGPPAPNYPARVAISYPEKLSRGLIFVKGFLVIPHLLALLFVAIGAYVMMVWAFLSVLFTGRYPETPFRYLSGTMRWGARMTAYMFLMTDAYPPFSLDDDLNYPVRLAIDTPQEIANWRPLVHWLLAFPALIASGLLGFAAFVAVFFAWFAILFTGRFPRGMFELVTVSLRWQARVNSYAYFMTEQYPPFVYG